jgi:adenylylsulfate reductase, subunit A
MLEPKIISTDILIIGGGTAGCYSALTIAEKSDAQVVIAEKANIKRSGCLAAGVNALNAYINPGETPESYLEYVKSDSEQIIRDDLVYSIAQRLNKVTRKIEKLGLPILKDENGNYISRGKRSIKINGENIKPILAKAVESLRNVRILNSVNIVDYIMRDNQVIGAYGFSIREDLLYLIFARAVICATGGAAGIYKPNNPGFSRHKMWYCPFNTGAGYAMGIRAGAEMTSFEMRFIALRCKDTIAPTGTIAQGVKAKQVNGQGEEYLTKYGRASTPVRLYATLLENQEGRGPCYLKTVGITAEQEDELYRAYLNMAPAQALKWVDQGQGPSESNVEIEGTEPYIVGGHTGSGYWIDTKRFTTLPGLLAAGDVAGGSPKKYVTGCFAEGEIAATSALGYIKDKSLVTLEEQEIEQLLNSMNEFLLPGTSSCDIEQVEEAMQKIMDEYAGGISTGYLVNTEKLLIAEKRIQELFSVVRQLKAKDGHELMLIHEILDRLEVCKVVIMHLMARTETRWPCYQSNADYPDKDDLNWLRYVNSYKKDDEIHIILRELVRDEYYEHQV